MTDTIKVVADGVVTAADVRTTPENDATLQQQQLSDMILEGYDAIVINAASPEGLNGAVKEACDAGVTVVSFDGIVTEPWQFLCPLGASASLNRAEPPDLLLSPKQIVPRLADEGRYLASESTFYRVLRQERQLVHRAAHPVSDLRGRRLAVADRWREGAYRPAHRQL